MGRFTSFAILSLWLMHSVARAEEELEEEPELDEPVDDEDSKVIKLTDEDFDEQVKDGKGTPWFVEFYAPWCGHCKALAPKWEELPGLLDGKVNVAKVDATQEKKTAEEFKVQGFPTLYMIADGKMYTYEGKRETEDMAKWAQGEYKSQWGKSLPKNVSPLEKAWDQFMAAMSPVGNVHNYVPWLMPVVFAFGLMWGFVLSSLTSNRVKVPKNLNETIKVNAVRDDKKSAGLEISPLKMIVEKVDKARPELKEVQVGDVIIGVDGSAVLDADDYRRLAHGKPKFVLTLGRSTNGNGKHKKDN